MVNFTACIQQFSEKGEKSGWTYIDVPSHIALQLKPGNKKTFRVKGRLDNLAVKAVALIPMGRGDFILALNAGMRKQLGKKKGSLLKVQLEEDKDMIAPSPELIECLADEPEAKSYFDSLSYSHKHYFSNWIESAKTIPTKTRRLAQTIDALNRQMDFGAMLRSLKQKE